MSTCCKRRFRASKKWCAGYLAVLSTGLYIVSAYVVFAGTSVFEDPSPYTSISALVKAVIDTVIVIMTPIIVLMIIYTGFLFLTAQGNAAKLSAARTSLMWTLIGAVLVLGAYGISTTIEATVRSVTG